MFVLLKTSETRQLWKQKHLMASYSPPTSPPPLCHLVVSNGCLHGKRNSLLRSARLLSAGDWWRGNECQLWQEGTLQRKMTDTDERRDRGGVRGKKERTNWWEIDRQMEGDRQEEDAETWWDGRRVSDGNYMCAEKFNLHEECSLRQR